MNCKQENTFDHGWTFFPLKAIIYLWNLSAFPRDERQKDSKDSLEKIEKSGSEKRMKVLVFGSLNVDYVYSVPHFVQPGETLAATNRQIFCGGKGLNQAIAFAKYGVETWQAGAVGAGDGEMLLKALQEAGVSTNLVLKKEGPSGHTIIQNTPEGENNIILFGGANQQISKEDVDGVLQAAEEGDYLILQNEISAISYLMEQAYKKGMHIVLNPSPVNEKIFKMPLEKVEYLILNEIEAAAILENYGISIAEKIKEKTEEKAKENVEREQEAEEKQQAAETPKTAEGEMLLDGLMETFPDTRIVLTLGKEGSRYGYRKERYAQGIFPVKTVDTTAAGDTFTGYFIGEMINGKTPAQALKAAAMASAIAVGKKGASPSIPVREEVEEKLRVR